MVRSEVFYDTVQILGLTFQGNFRCAPTQGCVCLRFVSIGRLSEEWGPKDLDAARVSGGLPTESGA